MKGQMPISVRPSATASVALTPVWPSVIWILAMPRSEAADQLRIRLPVLTLQVTQKTVALADHHDQPPAGVIIMLVLAHVVGQRIDPLREQRDLHLRRAGVALMRAIFVDDIGLLIQRKSHGSRFSVGPSTGACLRKGFSVSID